jgi:hypothetical protein
MALKAVCLVHLAKSMYEIDKIFITLFSYNLVDFTLVDFSAFIFPADGLNSIVTELNSNKRPNTLRQQSCT